MIPTLILIVIPVVTVLLILRRLFKAENGQKSGVREKDAFTQTTEAPRNNPSCNVGDSDCGVNCFCDEATLARATKTEAEYFEDEELDRYKDIGADNYTEQQIEEFNKVLTTLKSDEVGDWLRSLELRSINLPSSLKDEALMLMNDTH